MPNTETQDSEANLNVFADQRWDNMNINKDKTALN